MSPVYGEKILVYLTRENRQVLDILKGFKEKFVVFGYNEDRVEENLEFREKGAFSGCADTLQSDYRNGRIYPDVRSVVSQETLFGPAPQRAVRTVLNSLFLKASGYGDYSDELKSEEVASF